MELAHTRLECGPGCEWIVMIHGFGGSQLTWRRQVEAFSAQYNLLLLDLPGHGESRDGIFRAESGIMRQVAEKIVALLHQQGIQRAHFLCVSLGTLVLAEILEIRRELVGSAVLCGAIFGMGPLAKLALRFGDLCKHFLPYMTVVRMLAGILMPCRSHSVSRKFLVQECGKLGRAEFARWYGLLSLELDSLRRRVPLLASVQSLVVMGRQDYIFLGQARAALHNLSGRIGLRIIENCGHVCSLQSWREFNRICLLFFSGVEPEADAS